MGQKKGFQALRLQELKPGASVAFDLGAKAPTHKPNELLVTELRTQSASMFSGKVRDDFAN